MNMDLFTVEVELGYTVVYTHMMNVKFTFAINKHYFLIDKMFRNIGQHLQQN